MTDTPFTDVTGNDPVPADEDPDGMVDGVEGLVLDIPEAPDPDPDQDEDPDIGGEG